MSTGTNRIIELIGGAFVQQINDDHATHDVSGMRMRLDDVETRRAMHDAERA